MAPIPICMCGKQPKLATAFTKMMLPEYEIVHHFHSTNAFHEEFPALMRGEDVRPRSGIGSNFESDQPKLPLAIFVGADFTEEELENMMQADDSLPWLAPFPGRKDEAKKSAQASQGGPSMMEIIVARVKECLKDHGPVDGSATLAEHGLWRF